MTVKRSAWVNALKTLTLIGLCAAIQLAGAAPGARAEPIGAASSGVPEDERIVQDFERVALRNEMVALPNPRVTKWARPLRVYIVHEYPIDENSLRGTRAHMAHLARLTGLDLGYVNERRRANFEIVFTSRSRFETHIVRNLSDRTRRLAPRLAAAVCLGFYRPVEPRNEILKAVVIIPVDSARRDNLLRTCIVEETTQMMGLPNDSERVRPSIFNDDGVHVELTWRDEVLLQMLYHPRMTVGLPRNEAVRVARQILPEILRERRIQALVR